MRILQLESRTALLCALSLLVARGDDNPAVVPFAPVGPPPTLTPTLTPPEVTPPPTDIPGPVPTDAPVPLPTDAPVPLPTDAPLPLPTEAPVPLPTEAPTAAPFLPTQAPVQPTNPPTMMPVPDPTEAPTLAPTKMPIMPVPDPTAPPTLGPSKMPTDSPTKLPTASPVTKAPTGEPDMPVSSAPTKAPVQTAAPTSAPVQDPAMPTVAPVQQPASVSNIKLVLPNVPQLDLTQEETFQDTVVSWFLSSVNNNRRLQEFATVIDVTSQTVTEESNTIEYTQTFDFFGSANVEALALEPFMDETKNLQLVSDLRQNGGPFDNLPAETALAVPIIEEPAPTAPPTSDDDEGFWTTTAIAGVAGGGGGLLLLCAGIAWWWCCCGGEKPDEFDEEQSPPTTLLNMKHSEEISTIDENGPKGFSGDSASVGNYGDQSVATVDYDYSKAYGGGGDQSVVSSVGGTLGDNTRQTAGDLTAGSAAARAALGANYNTHEEVIIIDAPAGKLGVVIDTPDEGAPVVHAVKDSSVIFDKIQVGDKLMAVDDDDVRSMTAIKVSKLISKKSSNPVRRLTIVRTTHG